MISIRANLFTPDGILQYFRPYCGRVYLKEAYLILSGVSANMLKVRKSEYTNGRSKRWAWTKVANTDGFEIAYDYETIPLATQQSLGMPTLGEVLVHFSESIRNRYTRRTLSTTNGREEVRLELLAAIASAGKEIDFFFDRNLGLPGSALICKKYCVTEKLIQLIDDIPGSISKLYEVISGLEFDNLGFPESLKSFYRFLDKAKKSSDLRKFIIELSHQPPNAKKRNEMVDKLVLIAAGHMNDVSIKMIKIWVNTVLISFPVINGGKTIEDTTVQEIIDNNKSQSKVFKLGEDYIRRNVIPFFELVNAINPWDQWQMDEWHVEFKAKDRSTSRRIVMFTIMDAASRKVIHVEFSDHINSEIVKKAISAAVKNSGGRFPAEVVCDFSTSNTATIMSDMFSFVKHNHPQFHWTISSNPNRKAILERWFGTLNSLYLSPHFGHTGTGWGERAYSGPAKFVEYLTSRPELLDDVEGLKAMISAIIDQYNRNGTHPDSLSPTEFISSHKAVNAIHLPHHEIAFVFGNKFTRQVINTTVECEVGNDKKAPMTRKYKSHSLKIAQYNETEVDVYINSEALEFAYLFEKDKIEFISDAKEFERFHTAHINKTEHDTEVYKKLIAERNAMIEKLMKQKPDAIRALSEATGVPVEDFLHMLTEISRTRSTDVSKITGTEDTCGKGANPFNAPSKKAYQKVRGKKQKEKESEKRIQENKPNIMSKVS